MIDAVAERSTMQSPTSQALPSVRLEHVSKSFGSRRVLDDVTLDVPAGCGFVILGRSGTGKSVHAAAHHRAGDARQRAACSFRDRRSAR